MRAGAPRIGCAGWSIPKAHAAAFPAQGSTLERYAQVFDCVEINSSFHRQHRPATWRRWADSVPADFRFAAKMPRAISHECRLRSCDGRVSEFLDQVGELDGKLGWLLLQLPPSLVFEASVALPFFERLRERYDGALACEPRHASWFAAAVDLALRDLSISRVAADPARVPRAALPGGDRRRIYLCGCMDRRARITTPTRPRRCNAWCDGCAGRRTPGASSTTRRWATQRPTPST